MSFVLDASMTMAWHFDDEATEQTDAVRSLLPSSVVHVPEFWLLEVTNILLAGERRARATPEQSARFSRQLQTIDLRVDREGLTASLTRILPLARVHRLSAYDTLYLELAERLGLPLATLDRQLATAAVSVGLTVL